MHRGSARGKEGSLRTSGRGKGRESSMLQDGLGEPGRAGRGPTKRRESAHCCTGARHVISGSLPAPCPCMSCQFSKECIIHPCHCIAFELPRKTLQVVTAVFELTLLCWSLLLLLSRSLEACLRMRTSGWPQTSCRHVPHSLLRHSLDEEGTCIQC